MKKAGLGVILVSLFIVFSINIVYAQDLLFGEFNADKHYSPSYPMNLENNLSNSSNEEVVEPELMKSSIMAFSSLNTITIVWPEPGYYYITDYFLLEISTANPSTCTYSLNSGPQVSMIDNETDHSEFISNLVDNMASDEPYYIDFTCDDGSGPTTDYTYFWINTTPLDYYLIRSNQGEWEFLISERYWQGYDEGLIDIYSSWYKKGGESIHDETSVFIFTNRTFLDKYLKKNLMNDSHPEISVQVIGGKNFYVSSSSELKYIAWTNGNYFIKNIVYPFENTTPVDLQIPNYIINPYLEKYPNDLRNGFCGDGKVNVLNLDGKKEECDKNSESVTCGSINIGECKLGKKIRTCRINCTWESYGACNATLPKLEVCDDKKDNDCDGLVDEGCERLIILSPNKSVYNTTKIQLSLNATSKLSKIEYLDNSSLNPKYAQLCINCSNYSKIIILREGNHTLIFRGTLANSTVITNQTKFIIDTKLPLLSTTKPMSLKYTNGSGFYIKYSEDNCKTLKLIVNNSEIKSINCKSGKNIEESFFQNISKYNNKTVNYRFKIIDIAGNIKESKNTTIKVDTTSPKINNFNYTKYGNYITFNMTILNENSDTFSSIQYIDNSELKPMWKSMCISLKNNLCTKKVYFKTGNHSIIVKAWDEAGNSDSKNANIKI